MCAVAAYVFMRPSVACKSVAFNGSVRWTHAHACMYVYMYAFEMLQISL